MADDPKDRPDIGSPPETVGADVPEKAQPLPPIAGSVSPADEGEAKLKAELPAGQVPKTEAKDEAALPGTDKPSKTPAVEGASESGSPPTPQKTTPVPPATGPAAVRPTPPRAPAAGAPPKVAAEAGSKPAPPPRKGPQITTEITNDPLVDRI